MTRTFALGASLSLVLFGLFASGCGHKPKVFHISKSAPPELEGAADQTAHASVPDGERIQPALFGVAHAEDEETDYRLQLEAGQCYWFGWAGEASIQKFSVYLFDPTDKRLDSARGKPAQGVFSHCAKEPGIYRFQTKVNEGAGHYAVVLYRKKGVVPPPPAVVDLAATIEKQAATAAPGATRVGEFFSGNAETSDWFTPVQPGKCYWFIGAGEPGKVKHLSLYLWNDKGTRITDSRSPSEQAMVGYCAKDKETGMYKFQAKVELGKGEYKVGVYVK